MMAIAMTLSKDRVSTLVNDYKKYLLTDKHPDTVRGYLTDIRDYLGWCESRGFDIEQVNDDHLLQYCRYLLDDRHCNVATVAKKIRAVRRYYCYLGYDY
jgi:site-specific recombinase XerD